MGLTASWLAVQSSDHRGGNFVLVNLRVVEIVTIETVGKLLLTLPLGCLFLFQACSMAQETALQDEKKPER